MKKVRLYWLDVVRILACFLVCIVHAPVHGVYWFLYVILGLYVMALFLSPTIVQSNYCKLYLILWGVSLFCPYFNAVEVSFWDCEGSYYRMLSPFGGFMGYMLLGYYLRYNVNTTKRTSLWCMICIFLAVIFPFVFYGGRFHGIQNGNIYDNLTINTAAMAIIYFLLIKCSFDRFNSKTSRIQSILCEISKKTFGIYLIHILGYERTFMALMERLSLECRLRHSDTMCGHHDIPYQLPYY